MITHMSNFHRLEVVGRGGDTQLQIGENLILQCRALFLQGLTTYIGKWADDAKM